jgi:hypothetical protein
VRLTAVFFFSFLFCNFTVAQDFDSAVEKQMFELVNKERTSRGIPALVWADKLQQSARKHTVEIAKHKTLSHQFSDEPNVQSRIAATGFHFNASAENVASATYAAELHRALMNSPGHRANILNPKYTAMGIGVVHSGDTYYATQNFATATEDLSTEKAEERIAKTLNDVRAAKGMPKFKFQYSRRLREAICSQADQGAVSAKNLFVDPGFYHVVAATSSDLGDVPEPLQKVISNPTVTNIAVGACFRVTPKYPGGMYWMGFEY